jgi:hypothetical protein
MQKDLTNKKQDLTDENFIDCSGDGFENVNSSDFLVPRIKILQALSPQVNKQNAKYIDGAVAGTIYQSGVDQLLGDKIMFIPAIFKKSYIIWNPRDSVQGIHSILSHDEFKKISHEFELNDKNKLIKKLSDKPKDFLTAEETFEFFGFIIKDGSILQCVISFTSTQIKNCRKLLSLAAEEKIQDVNGNFLQAPLYYRSYLLSVVPEKNANYDWYGWKVEKGLKLSAFNNGGDIFDSVKSMNINKKSYLSLENSQSIDADEIM